MRTPEERERESRETDDTAFERAAKRDEELREVSEAELERDPLPEPDDER